MTTATHTTEPKRNTSSNQVAPTSTRTDSNQGSVAGHVQTIKEDVSTLKSDLSVAAAEATHVAHEKAQQALDVAKTGGERAKEAHEKVCKTVSKHPTASVLLALGAGLLVGRAIGGR